MLFSVSDFIARVDLTFPGQLSATGFSKVGGGGRVALTNAHGRMTMALYVIVSSIPANVGFPSVSVPPFIPARSLVPECKVQTL